MSSAKTPEVSRAMLELLRDPASIVRPVGPEAHSRELLHAHALRRIASALETAGLDAMLVKGAALGLTVYPTPAARTMQDIDLLAREGQAERVVAALVTAGCDVRPEPERPHSQALLGEVGLYLRAGAMAELVEVHTTLSKVVDRPIDSRELFARASPAPSLPGLWVPAAEDHALLVALHAAGHEFTHPVAFLDLELLLRRGLDARVLAERARAWRLSSVMYAMLSAMRELGAASVTSELVARFDPGPLRRGWLEGAAARGLSGSGLGWVAAQTPLRDDPLAWSAGVARYAVARARDRLAHAHTSSGEAPGASSGSNGGPSSPFPLWVRALLGVDRTLERVGRAFGGVRDEALLSWIPPEQRDALTAAVYAGLPTYLPGGKRHAAGLFGWEERVFSSPPFPTRGRILLGAAGAGRELVALVERGFDVVAFDPCGPFVEAARRTEAPDEARVRRMRIAQASYADLVHAVHGHGPLASLCAPGSFDAVVLGWGSLSHVLPASARAELFGALRVFCPAGPVVASFGLLTDAVTKGDRGRMRRALGAAFAALGAPARSEEHDHFLWSTGFVTYLTPEELQELARGAGYAIALLEESPYPHAVLVPGLDSA